MVAITTALAGFAAAGSFIVDRNRLELEERQHELEVERERAEEEKQSTSRKIAVIKQALLSRVDAPTTSSLPVCDIPDAEALIQRLVERSPVLVIGYQGTGKSYTLSKMCADRRWCDDAVKNAPAVRIALRRCLRDRYDIPGVLFRIIAEETGLGDAVLDGTVVDDLAHAHRYLRQALRELRSDGYAPCLFVVDDIEMLFSNDQRECALQRDARGWCQWLLELHAEGLIRLVLITSDGSVYLDLIKYSGFESRLERVHFPNVPRSTLVDYLKKFNSESESVFTETSAEEFSRVFTGFTDIEFARTYPGGVGAYCRSRLAHAKGKLTKCLEADPNHALILSSLPCDLSVLQRRMNHLTLAEIEVLLDGLVEKNIIAPMGYMWEWNRRILKEAYRDMGWVERWGGFRWKRWIEKQIRRVLWY